MAPTNHKQEIRTQFINGANCKVHLFGSHLKNFLIYIQKTPVWIYWIMMRKVNIDSRKVADLRVLCSGANEKKWSCFSPLGSLLWLMPQTTSIFGQDVNTVSQICPIINLDVQTWLPNKSHMRRTKKTRSDELSKPLGVQLLVFQYTLIHSAINPACKLKLFRKLSTMQWDVHGYQ